MKFLIIPVHKTLHEDFNKICEALRANGESEYATFVRRKLQWGEVTATNPYIEVKVEENS